MIFGGAGGTIHKIDLHNGLFVHDFKFEDGSDIIIWDLLYRDSYIVSADSRGNVIIWNDKFGTVSKVFNSHYGDVLALAFYSDGLNQEAIYSSGVDNKIVCYRKLSANNLWVEDNEFRIHFSDIYALDVSSDGLLASGGVDSHLAITDIRTNCTKKYVQSQDSSYFFSFASEVNILLHQMNDSIKLWKIFPKHQYNLPVNCLTINLKSAYYILSCSISSNATKLAISTVQHFWLYEVSTSNLTVHRLLFLKLPSFKQRICDNKVLLATIDEGFKVYYIQSKKWKNFKDLCPHILDFCCNEDGTLLVAKISKSEVTVCDLLNEVTVYNIKNILSPLYAFQNNTVIHIYLPDDGRLYHYNFLSSTVLDCDVTSNGRKLFKAICPISENMILLYCKESLSFISSGCSMGKSASAVQVIEFEGSVLFISKMSNNEIIVVEQINSNNSNVVVKERYGT